MNLLACMRLQTGGGIHWAFEQDNNTWCNIEGLYWHELVALAKYLLKF